MCCYLPITTRLCSLMLSLSLSLSLPLSLSLFLSLSLSPNTGDNLFFLEPIPPTVSIFVDRLELCAVPDIPHASITIIEANNTLTGNNYFYCRVETERGIFRSRSVIALPGGSQRCGKTPLLCHQMAIICVS